VTFLPVRAQVILHTDDAISANYVTNSWCIKAFSPPDDGELQEYTDALKAFYNNMRTYFGDTIAQNGHEVKYYDLTNSTPPNYPMATDVFNLTSNPSVDGMPSEVALCLSFQGTKASGFPQARRRGRIYFGPIVSTASAGGRPTAGIMTAMANAATQLASDLAACSNIGVLSVWSTSDGVSVDVDNGWVDNAFDTQRRRGIERTSRTTWVA
jgi:hypothetical protein